jgi:glycine C-acetyltransferase
MNSNSYLGMSLRPRSSRRRSRRRAVRRGSGRGALHQRHVRPHVALERRLAAFHGREAAMIFSSAYATVVSTLVPLTTERTILISDELNHNCIINAMRLARPQDKASTATRHGRAEQALERASTAARRALVVTDGIFSMRGDHAPLDEIMALARRTTTGSRRTSSSWWTTRTASARSAHGPRHGGVHGRRRATCSSARWARRSA